MDSEHPDPPGLLGSFRNLCENLLGSLHDRVALVSLELKEEKLRQIQVYFWINAILFAGVMAATFGSLTLVYLFWEKSRFAVLGGLTLLYSAAFVSIIAAFRRYLARQPLFLAATLQEIRQDRECFRTKN
jgi:uncharacterized membrane protein YqjE